jgi:hypothetical protein
MAVGANNICMCDETGFIDAVGSGCTCNTAGHFVASGNDCVCSTSNVLDYWTLSGSGSTATCECEGNFRTGS